MGKNIKQKYDGFYVWVHKAGRIKRPKLIAKYLGKVLCYNVIIYFPLDILDKNITQKASFYPWVGKLCDSNFIIGYPISRINMGMRIKCGYIPPKTALPFNVYSSLIKNSYKIQYYSKTTKFTEKEVVCN